MVRSYVADFKIKVSARHDGHEVVVEIALGNRPKLRPMARLLGPVSESISHIETGRDFTELV